MISAVDASGAGETAALGVADGTTSPKPAASRTGETATPTAAEVESNVPRTMGEPADLDLLGERIAELSARIQAATYELLCALREFDRHIGWEGFRSCAHWLNWRTGLDLGAGREKLRVAGALADLNHLSAAMACGRLSYSVVRALTRVATPDNEASLVVIACCATGAQVERMVRAWPQADEAAQPDAERVRLARRALSTRVDEDGMAVLRARLTPEVGAMVLRALEAALEQVPLAAEGDEAGIAQRRADALGLVAESALAGGLDPGNAGDRFQVTMHVEAETLRTSETARAAADTSAGLTDVMETARLPAAQTLLEVGLADAGAGGRDDGVGRQLGESGHGGESGRDLDATRRQERPRQFGALLGSAFGMTGHAASRMAFGTAAAALRTEQRAEQRVVVRAGAFPLAERRSHPLKHGAGRCRKRLLV